MSGPQGRTSLDSFSNLDPISSGTALLAQSSLQPPATNSSTSLPEVPAKDNGAASANTSATSTQAPLTTPSPTAHNNNLNNLPNASVELLNDDKIRVILNSDSALDALLKRLKESIGSCDEFAKFIKKKSAFQEEYDYQVKKLAKNTQEYLKHNASNLRQDSFTRNFDQIVNFDDRLHNVGYAYVTALQTMSDELFQLSATMQRQRRNMKEDGKRREKEVSDAIQSAEKAKIKYDNFCVELEKVRTNEPGKKFTLKGSKTTSQQEEELLSKIEHADKDYSSKVALAKRLKDELLRVHRPANSKALKDLILEIDLAMSVQLQKYATWCENLLMNSGVLISPLRPDARKASMKNLAASVDNEKDLYDYLVKYQRAGQSKALIPVDYKVHPTLVNTQTNYNTGFNNTNSANNNSNAFTSNVKRSSSLLRPKKNGNVSPVQNHSLLKVQEDVPTAGTISAGGSNVNLTPSKNNNRFSYIGGSATSSPLDQHHNNTLNSAGSTDNINSNNLQVSQNSDYSQNNIFLDNNNNRSQSALPATLDLSGMKIINRDFPLIFGGPIDELCLYENESVPLIVRSCINIIDNYGLELEGIYRTSGNSTKIHQLKDALNNDRSMIDKLITNPEQIIDSDIYCIASLLKLYFAQLPEPLLTNHLYQRFLTAVKIPEPAIRKKRLHEIVFELPDANYFTLRAIIFHLCRIVAKQDINRMSARNLGIIWGPNLLPSNHTNAEDMSYQGKVVENLMYIANDIFEPEE